MRCRRRHQLFPGLTNESPPTQSKPTKVVDVSFVGMSLSRVHKAAASLIGDEQYAVDLTRASNQPPVVLILHTFSASKAK